MKVTAFLKDPDGYHEAVQEACRDLRTSSDPDREVLIEAREKRIQTALNKWFEYKEYIVIEFDLDEMTARVIERPAITPEAK